METTEQLGISVIICCYNSAGLIKDALEALAIQKNTESINWEVVLVDNNSNDGTAALATETWKSFQSKVPFRVIYENTPGLIHARKKGIQESKNNILVFCDDDNRFCDQYIAIVHEEFKNDPKLAVLGGIGTPVYQTKKPEWFDKYAINYAVGPQKGALAKIKNLYGAGIALNRVFLSTLKSKGFNAYLTGRKGDLLLAGEDTEIIYALQFIDDIRFKYNEQLTFEHFLTSKRLSIEYLCEMRFGIGAAKPFLKIYEKIIKNQSLSLFYYYRELANCYVRLLFYYMYPHPGITRPKIAYEKGHIQSLKAIKDDLYRIYSELHNLKTNLS